MSKSQQGPEICGVISEKRYLKQSYKLSMRDFPQLYTETF